MNAQDGKYKVLTEDVTNVTSSIQKQINELFR